MNYLVGKKFKIGEKFIFPDHYSISDEIINNMKDIANKNKFNIITTEKNKRYLKPWEPTWSPNELERSSFGPLETTLTKILCSWLKLVCLFLQEEVSLTSFQILLKNLEVSPFNNILYEIDRYR